MSQETDSNFTDLVGSIEDYVELRRPRVEHIIFPDLTVGLRVRGQQEKQEPSSNLRIDLERPLGVVGEKLLLFTQEGLEGEFYFTRVDTHMFQLHFPSWGFGHENGPTILILEDTVLVHEWEIRSLLKDFKAFFKACTLGEAILKEHLKSHREWKENVLSFIE